MSVPTEPPANVLLLETVGEPEATCECCGELLDPGGDTIELRVSFADPAERGTVNEAGDRRPVQTGLVTVGDSLRSAAADSEFSFDTGMAVEAVEDPENLQAIGMAVSEFCESWEVGAVTITVCFDSLTALLDHVDHEDAFKFVHVLTNRLETAGALAHFHVDPDAHSEEVVTTFGSLFDEVVTPEGTPDPEPDDYPQATDEEIARMIDRIDDGGGLVADGDREFPPTVGSEATDEDIAKALED